MEKTSKKRQLTPEELQECSALNAIYKAKKKELGITQERIAIEGLKAGSQSAASHYLTGRNALNVEAAAVFSKYLQCSVADFSPRLATEIATMARRVNIASHAHNYKVAEDEQPHTYGHEQANGNVSPMLQPTRQAKEYPLISWVAAGARAESPDNYEPGDAEQWLQSTENAGPGGYWLQVKGKSMVSDTPPSFPEGTPILVQPEGFDLISGKFYIFKHLEGETTFKQFNRDAGRSYLTPLNSSFEQQAFDDQWRAIGRVIDAKITGL